MELSAYGDWQRAVAMLEAAEPRSDFVRRQLVRSGLSIAEATASPEGFRRILPVRKEDFLSDQAASPPFGSRLVLPPREVALVVESSGSSGHGRETHYLTRADMERLAALWGDHLAALGITSDDVVALTFPIGMAGGGVKHAAAYAHIGAKVLRVANLSTDKKLDAMRYYGATALVATPSYLDQLAIAAQEAGTTVGALGVKRLVVATQSVSVDWVQRTEQTWGARVFEWYGTSAGLVAFSCRGGMVEDGRHGTLHWAGGSALAEVVNPETGELAGDGERGELIGTVLINEAEPFFRYATGDEVRFLAPGSCSCGSSLPGIESGTVRRLDQMFKIKGINIWPAAIEAVLFDLRVVADYRARFGYDSRRRELAAIEVLAPEADAGLAPEIEQRLRDQTGLHFAVAVTTRADEWSQETAGEAAKTKRWLDERQL